MTDPRNSDSAIPQAKAYIQDMAPYVPGRSKVDGVSKVAKMSSNECVFGASPKAIEAYQGEADSLLRYPDPESVDLRQTIAELHGLPFDQLICGAGSDELLTLLIHAYAGPGDEVIYSQYGFMVYPIQTKAAGATGVPVPNGEGWAASVDGILAAVTEKTKLVFIDNPCNPTGGYLPWAEVERLHAGLPETVVLVLDGAYAECVTANDYHAGADLVARAKNVIMTRTLSKQYALAALRVGWAYGPPEIIDILNRVRMPFNVNVHAGKAAVAAIKDQDHLATSKAFNAEWRDYLTAGFNALGLDVVPSQTNFVLVGFPDEEAYSAENAYAYLTEMGFLVRWLPGQGLANHLRITVGTEEQNRAIVDLLRSFLNDADMLGHNSAGEGA